MTKEEGERYAEFIKLRRANVLKEVLSSRAGRIFIATLIDETAPMTEAYKGNADTYYFLGKQAIGRHLLSNMVFNGPEMLDLFKQMNEDLVKLKEEAMSYAKPRGQQSNR